MPIDPSSQHSRSGGGYFNAQGGTRKTRQQVETSLDVLVRRRWIIIGCLLVAGVAAAVFAFVRPQFYEASAVVLVDLERMPGAESSEVIGNTPFVRSERSLATEVFVLQHSFALAQRVGDRLGQTNTDGTSRTTVNFEPANRSIASAIVVRATSPDPSEAANLANAYASEYVAQTQDASRTYLAASRVFLEEQEARRSAELREVEDALQRYQRRAGPVALSPESSTLVNRMVGMETSRDEAMIEIQMRRSQIASLERELEQINPQLARRMSSGLDGQLSVLRRELDELEGQRSVIQSFEARRGQTGAERLAPIERRIAAVEAEVHQLSEQYLEEVMAVGGIDTSAEAVAHAADLRRRSVQERIALEGLEARTASMNQRLGAYRSELNAIPELSTDHARLERERQLAERMYAHVVARLQDTRIQEESEPGYARVLRQAVVPTEPVGLDPIRMIIIGLLLGLIAGIALAVTRDRLDTRVYKPEQLRKAGLGVLGIVPNLARHIREVHGGSATVNRGDAAISTSLVTLTDPMCSAAETFRHVRTALHFSRMDRAVKSVVVTSSSQGDGKSTVSANLAVTMAQAQQRVLLIDADLRRPRIHKLFGSANAFGLAQILWSDVSLKRLAPEAAMARFRSSQHPNLFILPSGMFGSSGVNPAEMFSSDRMRDFMASLREYFDVIMIDTPPVLVANDAVELATLADAVVVVARAASSKEGDLEHTLGMLDGVNAPVSGLVLNDFDLSLAYGYRYTYGHYSKHGPYTASGDGMAGRSPHVGGSS